MRTSHLVGSPPVAPISRIRASQRLQEVLREVLGVLTLRRSDVHRERQRGTGGGRDEGREEARQEGADKGPSLFKI